jgi:hypothetical protein
MYLWLVAVERAAHRLAVVVAVAGSLIFQH